MAALLAVPLGGCSVFGAPREIRGNRVDPEQLAQITPGVQTRQDVTALLGSPSATGTFDPNEWYYISEVTHIRPAQMPGVSDQRIVAITFDQGGVVRNIRELTDKDRNNVSFVSRETPSPGTERSVLQQLFGNIGRFNGAGSSAGSATNEQGPGGGPGR
ncbi:outer membrane protein assembly factor BamE [Roseomonas gilardii]|jgi:outer membrane protein assembly factor BamE (lipoprotein component of BamABCDE complex)|nr:outer membrane protein assembly factor BamE [Roseomonas gilardii]MDT8331875.1 outer membrane protein assembly factor BamE [Roseomonas gilardii]PZR16385.1 MAG: outer membrane protein assembly factor BamE [Azospirillum brasilense]